MVEISRLQAAGFDVVTLSPQQRQVFENLSIEELDVLVAIKRRLDDAENEADGDVEGHHFANRGGAYW
jgi:hypothetical protein